MNFINNIKESLKWAIPTDTFYVTDLIQIIIIFFVLYYIIKTLKDTRAWVIVKGLAIVFFAYALTYLFKLSAIQFIMEQIFSVITIALVIMFQPELRKMLENIGKKDFDFSLFKKIRNKDIERESYFSKKTIDEVVIACSEMSKVKTGALIVFERDIPLSDYINSGIDVNATITNQLLINIFEKNTPLHDGASIVKNDLLKAATCYLPLSDSHTISKALGTRHRAGIGITEVTDAFVVIVSEENGNISWCENGRIKHNVTTKELSDKLSSIQYKNTIAKNKKHKTSTPKLFTKIAIAFASIALWGIVLNMNDEVRTTTIHDVPVSIINEDAINDIDQTFEIIEGDKIDVTIKAKRSIIEKISKKDIVATADLEKLSYVYSVPIDVSVKGNVDGIVEITDISNNTMKLELEEIVAADCPIEVETTGTKLDDYYVNIDSTTPTMLKVVGPKSKVSILDKAIVQVDVTDKKNDFVSSEDPILYDKNGNIVSNENLTFNYDKIKVNALVYETKNIPLNVFLETNYTDNNYYELIKYSIENDYITIAANDETLANIESIDIPVVLNDNSDSASSILVNLENYLPENVYLANSQEKQIQIALELNKYTKKQLTLAQDDIKIVGLSGDVDFAIEAYPSSLDVYINEKIVKFDELTINSLNPTIKIDNNEIGGHSSELRLKDIDGVLVHSNLNITYTLQKKDTRK